MIKEILKGNNIPNISKFRAKKINSVLTNFIKSKRINFKKKTIQSLFEKANSMKIILAKQSQQYSQKKSNIIEKNKNYSSSYSRIGKNRNSINIKNSNSYSLRRRNDLSYNTPLNLKCIYFEEKKISEENFINKSNDFFLKNNIRNKKFEQTESENGKQEPNKKNVYLKNTKFDNFLFLSNLEREFEIRRLKKKIQTLKNNNKTLTQNLDNLIEKNNKVKKEILKNNKKGIITSTINICKNQFNGNQDGDGDREEMNFRNLLLNLMDLKYNYEKTNLKNNFLSGTNELFKISKLFNDKNRNNKKSNNSIYYNIKNLIRLKNKYINDIKQYNIQIKENKKYYNYLITLCKKLSIDNVNNLFKYLKSIKSCNEQQIRKIIKMKRVLFDENKIDKKRININASVDNLIKRKKFAINFNYADLQKYFIEKNKKNSNRNFNSVKLSNMTIKTENNNNNNFSRCVTNKVHFGYSENNILGKNSSIKKGFSKNNYYNKKREELFNNKKNFLENNSKKIKRMKSNIINIDQIKENEKENNYLYYSSKNKINNIPHNNRTFKKIEIKKDINQNCFSKKNLTCFNKNTFEKNNINRIKNFKINQFNNSLYNSLNLKLTGVSEIFSKSTKQNGKDGLNENNQLKDNNKTENYINSFKIKKKSLFLKIPSLKLAKNYRTRCNTKK